MEADTKARRLTVFLTEDDRVAHQAVCELLLRRARDRHRAGATVWRGIEGFGRSGQIRTLCSPEAVVIRTPAPMARTGVAP